MPGKRRAQGDQQAIGAESPPRGDPRRYPRVPLRVEVISKGRTSSRNYAINLSSTGLCLQSAERCEPGQRLCLRFRLYPRDPWVELEAEVVWCTREEDLAPGMSYWELGLRFLRVPHEAQELLEAFMDRSIRFSEVLAPVPGSKG